MQRMLSFSGKSKGTKTVPVGPVEAWKSEDVRQWLSLVHLEQHREALRPLTGKRVLHVSKEELHQLLRSRFDTDVVWDAIQNLRKQHYTLLPELQQQQQLVPQGSTASMLSTERSAISSTIYQPSMKEGGGLRDHAEVLAPFADGAPTDEVAFYLSDLGRLGAGLAAAAAANEAAGGVFGAAFTLHMMAEVAHAQRSNCNDIAALAQDVVRLLDHAGRRQQHLEGNVLEDLAACLSDACAVVDAYCREGWLLRAVCNEHAKKEFERLHGTVLHLLQASGLSGLLGGRPLPQPYYADASKPLRRCLRQLGGGSLNAGMTALKAGDEKGLEEVAKLLGVELQAVQAELALLPAGPLDVDALYQCLCAAEEAGVSGPEQHAAAAAFSTAAAAGGLGQGAAGTDGLGADRAVAQLRESLGTEAEEDLHAAFMSFANFGTREAQQEMDSAHFVKLCRDCGLLGDSLSATDADLLFCKVKTKGQRRISFGQFVAALAAIADKTGQELEEVVCFVVESGAPVAHATQADAVRLHDDKSTYTGVYARGGPSTIEPSHDLSAILDRDRSDADMRGTLKKTHTPQKSPGQGSRPSTSLGIYRAPITTPPAKVTPTNRPSTALSTHSTASMPPGRLTATHSSAALHGTPGTGRSTPAGRGFAGRSSAAGSAASNAGSPASSKLTRTHPGLASTATGRSTPAARTSSSSKLAASHAKAAAPSAAAPGSAGKAAAPLTRPSSARPAAAASRTSPSAGAADTSTISADAPRTPASAQRPASAAPASAGKKTPLRPGCAAPGSSKDTRAKDTIAAAQDAAPTGRAPAPSAANATPTKPTSTPARDTGASKAKQHTPAKSTPNSKDTATKDSSIASSAALQQLYTSFANFGIHNGPQRISSDNTIHGPTPAPVHSEVELDGFRFNKLCRECGVVDAATSAVSVDLVFAKVKAKGAKKITFKEFQAGLALLARAKGVTTAQLAQQVLAVGGPGLNHTTTPDAVRLHDDRTAAVSS